MLLSSLMLFIVLQKCKKNPKKTADLATQGFCAFFKRFMGCFCCCCSFSRIMNSLTCTKSMDFILIAFTCQPVNSTPTSSYLPHIPEALRMFIKPPLKLINVLKTPWLFYFKTTVVHKGKITIQILQDFTIMRSLPYKLQQKQLSHRRFHLFPSDLVCEQFCVVKQAKNHSSNAKQKASEILL